MIKLPNIYGFNKTSEAGENVFAPSIFLGGCNLRCPYCMNSLLVKGKPEPISINEVKQYVIEEKCDWVMISGGEPTITPTNDLIALINEIRSWGCKVGLSTNGSNPRAISEVLSYINYVALDIKCCRNKDAIKLIKEGEKNVYLINLFSSWYYIVKSKIDRIDFNYEVRTTLFPPFVDREVIKELGSSLRFDTTWILQQFRHSNNMLDKKAYDVKPYNEEEINELLDLAKKYCKNVKLRYV